MDPNVAETVVGLLLGVGAERERLARLRYSEMRWSCEKTLLLRGSIHQPCVGNAARECMRWGADE